jgi:Mg2+ and Co2+ transporter CorA
MTAQELQLKIDTEYDGKGADAAAKDIEKIGKASKKAGEEQDKAGKHAQQFGQSTGRAAEMVGSLTGAMGQSGPAAARMGAGLRVIKALAEGSAGGLAGLATVLVGMGVSAWASYQRKVEEAQKKLQEFMAGLTDAKIDAGAKRIDSIAEGFSRVEKAISATRAAQSELAAAWDDLNRAGQEVTAMELERREKAALARVAPGDQAGAAAVRARYAGLRESAALGQRAGDAIRAEQAARDDLAAISGRRANIEQTLGSSVAARDLIAAQLARSTARADPMNKDEEERKRATQEVAAFTAQLAKLDKQVADLTDALAAARTSEKAAGIRVQAAGLRATSGIDAASALAAQNTSDAETAAVRERWGQRLGDLRRRASSASSSLSARSASLSAAAEAFDPQRADYPHQGAWNQAKIRDRRMDDQAKGAARLSASAAKLDDQLSKMKPEQLAGVFDSITAQLARLETAVKNAEQRSKRQ